MWGGGGGGGHPLPLKRRCQSLAPSDGAPDDAHTCTRLHNIIMNLYMYIYHFLVSWNEKECDYWHTNRVVSDLRAAHTYNITPTSQRACAVA